MLACEADARGRTGYEDRPYPQADIFRRAYAAARAVDTTAIATDRSGPEIGAAIRSARIGAIRSMRAAA